MSARVMFALAILFALPLAWVPGARADEAPAAPDTTVEGYVRSMADSTDRWFGLTAQPADTTGLDSLLASIRRRPAGYVDSATSARRAHRLSLAFAPAPGFNRVMGPVYGGTALLGGERAMGRLAATVQWAAGPDRWFGNGTWSRAWGQQDESPVWKLKLQAGRWCDGMDRDFHWPALSSLRAFLLGSDHAHYLRIDGAKAELSHALPRWSAGVSARAMLESPMATNTTWYLTGHSPQVVGNLAATPARVSEIGAWGAVRPGRTNLELIGRVWSAGGALGGDADYTRLRLSAGHAGVLGPHVVLVTEADYGRLTGSALPQDAFYLGGTSLYSVGENSAQGTGRAIGRIEVLLVDPLQRLLGFDRYPVFPIQLGVFAATAACWGADPATRLARRTERNWPESREWLSEAGVSLMYRPGLPDPDTFVRVSLAWPLGPGPNGTGIAVTYTRPLSLLQRH